MAHGYQKRDIDFHDDGGSSAFGGGTGFPAVNVKHQGGCFHDLQAAFPELTDHEVEEIGGQAWEDHCRLFWDITARDIIDKVWSHSVPNFGNGGERGYREGAKVEFTSAGRSSGWLVVTNLGDVDTVSKHWSGGDVARWGRFERLILAEVGRLNSSKALIETCRVILEDEKFLPS